MNLRTLNYGNYGIFLTMGNAGFCPSAVLVGLGTRNHDLEPGLSKVRLGGLRFGFGFGFRDLGFRYLDFRV